MQENRWNKWKYILMIHGYLSYSKIGKLYFFFLSFGAFKFKSLFFLNLHKYTTLQAYYKPKLLRQNNDCVRCGKYSLPLVGNIKYPPLLCQILQFPTTWTLTSYGKEPQQSGSKRGRVKRIPPNKQTDNNKIIMTKSTKRSS